MLFATLNLTFVLSCAKWALIKRRLCYALYTKKHYFRHCWAIIIHNQTPQTLHARKMPTQDCEFYLQAHVSVLCQMSVMISTWIRNHCSLPAKNPPSFIYRQFYSITCRGLLPKNHFLHFHFLKLSWNSNDPFSPCHFLLTYRLQYILTII